MMAQLILHLLGDYLLQSEWMAVNKTRSSWAAFCHATVYSLPFFLIGSVEAVAVIGITHFFIDRFRLARFAIYAKNLMSPPGTWRPWRECSATGCPPETPGGIALALGIVCDNSLHLIINFLALRWL